MSTTNLNFSSQISEWVRQTKERERAVFRESSQRVIEQMISLTPVDTGFLRSSLMVTTTTPEPISATAKPVKGQSYPAVDVTVGIATAEVGDTIYAAFSASYAIYVEFGSRGKAGRGFVRQAAQRWPSIVDQVAAELQSRVTAGSQG